MLCPKPPFAGVHALACAVGRGKVRCRNDLRDRFCCAPQQFGWLNVLCEEADVSKRRWHFVLKLTKTLRAKAAIAMALLVVLTCHVFVVVVPHLHPMHA